MNWRGKRVLVTGAGGFIGSHLVERLVELGATTRAYVHYNAMNSHGWLDQSPVHGDIEVVAGDVCDPDSVRQAMTRVEVVFHLAALIAIPYSYRAPRSYVRTNIEGTLNVLQAAQQCGLERLVHTSTSEVYGTAQYVPINEAHPLRGQSPYAASKIGADQIAGAFHCSFGVPVVTVRPFNTFGPRQSERAILPTIISQCLVGQTVKLGNIGPTRDLTFVADTVEGFVLAASTPEAVGKTLNLGSGRETSIGDLVHMVADILGRAAMIEADEDRLRPDASEVMRLLADSSLAKTVLGWQPSVALEAGLVRTVEWMKANSRPDCARVYAI